GNPLGQPGVDQFGRGGFPDDGAIDGVVLEAGGDHLDALVEVGGGLDAQSIKGGLGDAVGATSLWGGDGLPVKPREGVALAGEVRRVRSHEKHTALVL